MDHQEYSRQLDLIEKKLDQKNSSVSEILEMLDKLYAYKPVSTRYHQLRCKALMKKGKTENLITEFEDKISKECIFEGNIELWQQIIEIYLSTNQIIEGKRQQYLLNRLIDREACANEDDKLRKIRQNFLNGYESKEVLLELEEQYLITCNRLMAYCVYLFRVYKYPETENLQRERSYLSLVNMAYMAERIKKKTDVILVVDKEKKEDYDILTYILGILSVPVYMIIDTIEEDGDYDLKESVQVSMENKQEYDDCTVIWAVARKAGMAGSNIPYIIDYICKKISKEDFCMVIASNERLEELRCHKEIAKRFERLSEFEARQIEDEIGFAWAGDYYTYISKLYRHDVREWVNKTSECEFSIVIPVRKATVTLEHTLRTCLEQDFKGKYEVVLSDNSINGDTSVYDLYKRIHNKKIKYYKTPNDLNLTKSFEYAFLQTNGKYIIGMGADDGAMPWMLSVLSMLWEQNPDRNIVSWERGFYAWPGFNGGQQNQLVIPARYMKGQLAYQIVRSKDYWDMIIENPQMMYSLPILYISSGFKRVYMKELYEKTGRLWDGLSQDIYMGLQNIAINKDILSLKYPLTIAGMSNTSIGTLSREITNGADQENKTYHQSLISGKGINAVSFTSKEMLMPGIFSDVSDLYRCIARLSVKGVLSVEFNTEQMEKIIERIYHSVDRFSDMIDRYVYEGYEKTLIGKENLRKWYEKNIIPKVKEHIYIDSKKVEDRRKCRLYREGFTENGGVILDASRYDVTNIYEAVQLFKSFLHF